MAIRSKITQIQTPRTYTGGALLVEGIPHTTKVAFKAACAQQERTMREVLIAFMRDYVRDYVKSVNRK